MINLGNGIIRNTRLPGYRLVGKGVEGGCEGWVLNPAGPKSDQH